MSWSDNPSPRSTNQTPAQARRECIKRDGGLCVLCGEPGSEVDHKNRTGTHELDNLQLLCRSCHKKKTQQESYRARQERKQRAKLPKRKTIRDTMRDNMT